MRKLRHFTKKPRIKNLRDTWRASVPSPSIFHYPSMTYGKPRLNVLFSLLAIQYKIWLKSKVTWCRYVSWKHDRRKMTGNSFFELSFNFCALVSARQSRDIELPLRSGHHRYWSVQGYIVAVPTPNLRHLYWLNCAMRFRWAKNIWTISSRS